MEGKLDCVDFYFPPQNDLDHSTKHCLSRVWHRLVPGIQGLTDGLMETRLWVASASLQETPPESDQLSAEVLNFYSKLRLVIVDCITAPFAPFVGAFPNESGFFITTSFVNIHSNFYYRKALMP